MALPNTNISVAMVKVNSEQHPMMLVHYVGIRSINKWSKWKPVRLNKLTGVTELDIISTEYSFVIDEERDDMGVCRWMVKLASWQA